MRIVHVFGVTALALTAGTLTASAQMGGGGGNTTRPSYDMPRAYDRDQSGNETYYQRNTWFGPQHSETRKVRKSKKKVSKKKYHHNYD